MKLTAKAIFAALVLLAQALTATALAQSPSAASVAISIDPEAVGPVIPPDFAGLSYESSVLLPDQAGRYYFSPANAPLITMFTTLGIKSLRVGGNAVDSPRYGIPDQTDIDSLFGFARAAHAKVIYSFRLKNGNIEQTVTLAKYITDHYAPELDCFAIGNEPNEYFPTFNKWFAEWNQYTNAILSQCPAARFCGPTAWKEDWAKQFSDALSAQQRPHIAFVAQHVYPFGPADHIKDDQTARDLLIGAKNYNKNFDKFGPEVLKQGLPYRIEETNSFAHGGRANASDSYVAALWGLDYLFWWAQHQAQGVNFHTGDLSVSAKPRGFRYSAFVTAADGYTAWPLADGMLAFRLGSQGRLVDSSVSKENATGPDLRAYAVAGAEHHVYVTLINRSHDAHATDARITLVFPGSFTITRALIVRLQAPGGDLSAKGGITVGGGTIDRAGRWNGQ